MNRNGSRASYMDVLDYFVRNIRKNYNKKGLREAH
jgi:hypothetical protein